MKKALISPNEQVYSYDNTLLGERVAEVRDTSFEVAGPLFWVDCPDDVVADQYYWSGSECISIPIPPSANTANV
jgi:hypothetical protein